MTRTGYIYLANIFLGLHYYLIIYINSSYLSQFLDKNAISGIYTIGALLSVLTLFFLPRFFNHTSAKLILIYIVILDMFATFGLAMAGSALSAAIFFILQQAVGILILYCLDLFLESSLKNERNTGWARAIFLTMLNISIIISFFTVSHLASISFTYLYLLSAAMLIPLATIIIWSFEKNIHKNRVFKIKDVWHFLKKERDAFRILTINFLLQFFYACMVVYLPFLLIQKGEFGWDEIGTILVVMILPFIIFEAPLGKLFDKKTGEKEFLVVGILIMAAATFTLSLISGHDFWLWATILFVSRIGASIVEICSESYFFKKVTDKDSGVISLFRITAPLAYVALPLLAIPLFLFTSYSGFFTALSLITLISLLFIPKVDTK